MEYITKDGQDIIDVTIQNFGDLETGLFSMFASNPGIGLNSNLTSGQKITLNNEKSGLIKEKTYFKQRKFVVNNADETQLSVTIGSFNSAFNTAFDNENIGSAY